MKIPIDFFDMGDTIRAYCALVTHTYLSAAQRARAAPTAESVLPLLCRFAAEQGLAEPLEFPATGPNFREAQIAKLCGCVQFVFKRFPAFAASLIEMDIPPISSVPPKVANDAEVVPRASLVTWSQKRLAEKALACFADGHEKEESTKVSAYQVEQALCKVENIRVIGEALFVYDDNYYQHISAECMRRLIMRDCRHAVEAAGTSRFIEEVFRFLLCDPDLFHQDEPINSSLVAFDNGVLDLRSGTLFPASPDYSIFYRLNTWWGNRASHPYFDKFLEDVCGGDYLLRERIFEVIGYCLVPDIRKKCFFVFQGLPDTGKSILAKFIRGCVNPDACTALDIGTLGERFVAANLVGKQLCLSMDIPSAPLNSRTVSAFKTMTGGDPITADVKYCPHITFFNHARFILGTNHPLLIQGEDPAFFKRAVTVPFLHSIPPEKQDPDLLERLNEERAAIVFDAVQAYRRLCERNYEFRGDYPINDMFQSMVSIPQSVEAMILDFVKNHCVIAPDAVAFVEDLYKRFCAVYPASGIGGNQFGGKVLEACQTLGFLNVHRGTKRRKEGCPNPQANLVGLAIKEE